MPMQLAQQLAQNQFLQQANFKNLEQFPAPQNIAPVFQMEAQEPVQFLKHVVIPDEPVSPVIRPPSPKLSKAPIKPVESSESRSISPPPTRTKIKKQKDPRMEQLQEKFQKRTAPKNMMVSSIDIIRHEEREKIRNSYKNLIKNRKRSDSEHVKSPPKQQQMARAQSDYELTPEKTSEKVENDDFPAEDMSRLYFHFNQKSQLKHECKWLDAIIQYRDGFDVTFKKVNKQLVKSASGTLARIFDCRNVKNPIVALPTNLRFEIF